MTIASSQQTAPEAATSPWQGFKTGLLEKEINVRDFVQQNYELLRGGRIERNSANRFAPSTSSTMLSHQLLSG